MLHILLLILKIIGILLAALLGLVLLLVLIVLFVPVRYYGSGSKMGKALSGRVKISWLFHAVTAAFDYEQGELHQDIHILGISLNKVKNFLDRRKIKKEKKRLAQTEKQKKLEVTKQTEDPKKPEAAKPAEKPEKPKIMKQADNPEKPKIMKQADNPEKPVAPAIPQDEPKTEGVFSAVREIIYRIGQFLKKAARGLVGIVKKILGIPGNVLAFFKKIKLTIASICDKITYWIEFLGDERTRAALSLLKSGGGKVLKHISPRKLQGEVTFGFEDPCTTGQILAGICALYPVYQDHIHVCPDFEQEILEGSLELKGRIYVFVLLHIAWTIYRNKNFKFVMKTFQHKEE